MRTVRAELEMPIGDTAGRSDAEIAKIRISTEVIIEDADAREAGELAARVVNDFAEGYAEAST